ncbi:sensor domain-containing diguanylate cyclase [Altererythrobacter sp. KTW20L]|uniref:sensor domain-containing diguanylate cyclase n=1 Tax=Altererythrobacter sp. KTW20L TaxID=2942210 RepID=UPI0020C12F4A|nr:sensor domain-containing diguanylate cyclase [Altererythrobacter sp. KTW20L]MCL6252328.1 sensor domain-containing diguanylate cyclase [Altererythrobacter sp. KTW20L]
MNWLRGPDRAGSHLERYRRLVWTGQLVTAVVLVAAVWQSGYAASVLTGLAAVLMVVQFAVSRILAAKSTSHVEEHEQLFRDAESARLQIEQLFAMTDMLQSAENHEDAGAILEATASQLLPEFRGALYIFNNSHDRLDLTRYWPHGEDCHPAETLVPGNCWALKRGKPHINDPNAGTLCCMHNNGIFSTIELPMIARGKVHGLLMLAIGGPDGTARLQHITRIARALADSVSLALANIALQEKLRTQSLRDPLTGLYNRRYMEDALERYLSMVERNGTPTSVVMIDLDHFKALNDTHGHAKGDAVLRDVAVQLVGALRPSDVVSRYGGEELLVIMPGCTMDDALLKAEVLRARIESLGAVHGAPVSASMGVACVPESSTGIADLVAMADTALYAAKLAGRNCVLPAKRRASSEIKKPKLAVG